MNQALANNAVTVTLPQGVPLVMVPCERIRTVTLHAWFLVGSAHEDATTSGISHFLEHMMFRGNQELGNASELSLAMEELGGEMNAATGYDHTEYWLELHRNYLELGINRFLKFLLHPSFQALETERQVLLEEIRSSYNEDQQLIDIDSLTASHLWPGQGMGQPGAGMPSRVEAIGLHDLQTWRNTYYHAGNLVLGISGDFSPALVETWFSQGLAGLAPGSRTPPPWPEYRYAGGVEWHDERDNQYQFQWSFPLPQVTAAERCWLNLVCRMLDDGSSTRLQQGIREQRGLVYDISANPLFLEGSALWQIQGQVSTEKLLELASCLSDLLVQVRAQGFTPAEFHLAKLRYQTSLDFFQDQAEGVLAEQVSPLLFPSSCPIAELQTHLEAAKLEIINPWFQNLLANRQSLFLVLGPQDHELSQKLKSRLGIWF